MSQSTGEIVTTNTSIPDAAIGTIALLEPDTLDDERWLGDGGACPAE